jgi:hypothetical protein
MHLMARAEEGERKLYAGGFGGPNSQHPTELENGERIYGKRNR